MKVIILVGGAGERLFPFSTPENPKQFVVFPGQECSLFQMAYKRARKLAAKKDVIIVTNSTLKQKILSQVIEIEPPFEQNVLLEPDRRNTLPAILYGIYSQAKEDTYAVLPSDHLIKNEAILLEAINQSMKLAESHIITFGIKPKKPHTGYGYISLGRQVENGFLVDEFKEKPGKETAKEYIKKGYLWNAGIFLFSSKVMKQETAAHQKQTHNAFENYSEIKKIFSIIEPISIDYGILENSSKVACVPVSLDWNDLGSFDSLFDVYEKDENSSILLSSTIQENSSNNLVIAKDKVLLVDIEGLIVVQQNGKILICRQGSSGKVREIARKAGN
ncbi:MAG TPA: mannose-1-phosphate guanylyltransferase/mannose-6-phosphate isomerase [Candidatus Woesearchaeota archaeon]|nr:mannose-1-phosphate guanylyltransferase/mannose-6-phosphate isomerase [Candidatus Woesearchaeota archaeon]